MRKRVSSSRTKEFIFLLRYKKKVFCLHVFITFQQSRNVFMTSVCLPVIVKFTSTGEILFKPDKYYFQSQFLIDFKELKIPSRCSRSMWLHLKRMHSNLQKFFKAQIKWHQNNRTNQICSSISIDHEKL